MSLVRQNKRRQIIVGERGSGKTTKLVYLSEERKVPIVVGNNSQKRLVEDMSKRLDVDIPTPVVVGSVDDLYRLRGLKGCLVDEATSILENLLGPIEVEGLTLTADRRENSVLHFNMRSE